MSTAECQNPGGSRSVTARRSCAAITAAPPRTAGTSCPTPPAANRTPGTAATQPLIALGDFGTDQTGGGGSFVITFDASGILLGYDLT